MRWISSSIDSINRMSDNNRRFACRLLFLLLCAGPTLLMTYWLTHRPGVTDWQEAIQAYLGLEINIDSLETPYPGETILRGVRIEQPFGAATYQVNEITIQTGNTNCVYINDLVSAAPEDLLRLLQQTSQHAFQLGHISEPWQIVFQTMAIDPNPESPDLGLILSPIQVDVSQDSRGVTATAHFQKANLDSTSPMQCRVFYPRDHDKLRQEIELDTGTSHLPCWLVDKLVGELANMGELATFCGTASLLVDTENRVSGRFNGLFDNINLQRLGEPVHQRLSGMAQANILDCEIVENRIRRLHAKLECAEGGWISPQVLLSAQHHLNLLSLTDRPRNQFVEYSSFGFEFLLDPPNDQFLIVDTREDGLIFDQNDQPLMQCSYVEAADQLQAYPLRIIDVANFWMRPSAQPTHQMVGVSKENLLANHGLIEFLNRLDRQKTRTADNQGPSNNY